jgi:hypothetical protein
MDILADVFKTIVGKAHFMIYMGKSPAAEIELKDKEISVNIVNPVALVELGIEEFLSRKGTQDIEVIRKVKEAGYRIKVKYKTLEMEL